jgi:hypothetical protein
MRDVLNLLDSAGTWKPDVLRNTRNFLYSVKYGEEGLEGIAMSERTWQKAHNIVYSNKDRTTGSRNKTKASSYRKQIATEKVNLNKQIERIEIRMVPGELVRHNKSNPQTEHLWEPLTEWTGTFNGGGFVYQLPQTLKEADIGKALVTWNIQKAQIKKIMAGMKKKQYDREQNSTREVAVAPTGETRCSTGAAGLSGEEGWQQLLKHAASINWATTLDLILTQALKVTDVSEIRSVVALKLSNIQQQEARPTLSPARSPPKTPPKTPKPAPASPGRR